jgi:chaperonin cofactor prefoldin
MTTAVAVVQTRLTTIDSRMEKMEKKMETIDSRMEKMEKKMEKKM